MISRLVFKKQDGSRRDKFFWIWCVCYYSEYCFPCLLLLYIMEPEIKHEHTAKQSSSPESEEEQESSFYVALYQSKKEDQGQKPQEQSKTQRKRYKYCCKKCKHTERGKKACVCVVPLSQRRTLLGDHGCQGCGCKGCSTQDYISRGEDPEYKPSEKKNNVSYNNREEDFEARNGCCRRCMKAFSKSNKACLCQVPGNVRKGKLPSSGCKLCGCHGCNPQDFKEQPNQHRKRALQPSHSRSQSRERRRKRKSSQSDSSDESPINQQAMNLNNFDNSIMGSMITNEHRIFPYLIGFSVPQRTQSYIMGKPK